MPLLIDKVQKVITAATMQEDAQRKQWDRLLQLAQNHFRLNTALG